jgi:hypothetical protein
VQTQGRFAEPRRGTDAAFAANLRLKYGPIDRLSRFFLRAEQEMAELGLSLSFGSFDELLAANRANSKTWRPLLPSFDPTASELRPHEAFCIFGRNAAGEVVATQAVRLFTWTGTNFLAEAESLRLFYTDPAACRAPNEECRVTAEPTRGIDGRVLFSGAGWYRPEYRGKGLGTLMPRISRLYGHSQWYIDFATCVMAEGVVAGGFPERAGYRHVDWELWMQNMPVLRDGTVRAAAVWMNTEDTLQDLDAMLARLDRPQVDGSIEDIGRQQHQMIRSTGRQRQ